jgi:hypothetical protein
MQHAHCGEKNEQFGFYLSAGEIRIDRRIQNAQQLAK